MQTLIDWIRSILILYFLMMIILYFTAGDSYKKYVNASNIKKYVQEAAMQVL